jgi:DNA helicase-2/ATP-dependent DNA helicase PcrA
MGRVWGGTFHGTANRLLRSHGGALGLPSGFTVLDRTDTADLMDLIRDELELGQGERRFPRKDTLADVYSRTVNARIKLSELLHREYPWCVDELEGIRRIFERYVERKRGQNALDYDDLLLFWQALCLRPEVRVRDRFDHVLVDEYQDTNFLQAEILAALRPDGRGLMVVGDDAQAIYGFRSATVRNILEFPDRFPGTTIVKLERNYRSTRPILDATNAVIALSAQRHEKTLWTDREDGEPPELLTCLDERDQADAVCRAILERHELGTPLKEQAVLFRAGHHSDVLEVELARRNIPFVKYGGLRFLESAHVKDALAVLRIADNPRDEVSWFRVLRLLDRVGPAGARRVMAAFGVTAPGDPMARFLGQPIAAPAPARTELERLRETFRDLATQEAPPQAQVERVRRFLEPLLRRRHDHPEPRLRDLEQLEQLADGFESRARFVADLAIDPPVSTSDLAGPPHRDEDYVVLSTIHSAKGGEWDVVHVIHAADGMIPSDLSTGDADELEEERRLFYVALTRARHTLRVYFPLRYHRSNRGLEDRHWYAQLTRFLPEEVRGRFALRTTYADDAPEDGSVMPRSADGAVGVDAMLAGLWSD